MLHFDTQVEEKTKIYNAINNIFYILVLIGAWTISKELSTIQVGDYYPSDKVEYSTLFKYFGAISITYTLFYAVIRVSIKNLGENLRSNYYKDAILDELKKISK